MPDFDAIVRHQQHHLRPPTERLKVVKNLSIAIFGDTILITEFKFSLLIRLNFLKSKFPYPILINTKTKPRVRITDF